MQTKGFTLIELLVSILIIGILVAVALPKYQTAVDKARYMTMVPIVDALARAEEAYYDSKGQYTDKIDALAVDVLGERWGMTSGQNSSGEDVELDRTSTIWIQDGYVTLNYLYGKTNDGHDRYDHYIYAINGKANATYMRFMNHNDPRMTANVSINGKRYCTVPYTDESRKARGIRLCKALGGKVPEGEYIGHYKNGGTWFELP